jgi:hypothetical protein
MVNPDRIRSARDIAEDVEESIREIIVIADKCAKRMGPENETSCPGLHPQAPAMTI